MLGTGDRYHVILPVCMDVGSLSRDSHTCMGGLARTIVIKCPVYLISYFEIVPCYNDAFSIYLKTVNSLLHLYVFNNSRSIRPACFGDKFWLNTVLSWIFKGKIWSRHLSIHRVVLWMPSWFLAPTDVFQSLWNCESMNSSHETVNN